MIRLMADDLTGALDAAAEFAGEGPVRVLLAPGAAGPDAAGPLAVVTNNRERIGDEARREAAARAARLLVGGAPAFVKIDSVLRGAPAVEIEAAVAALRPDRVVLAPAFPAQGRITRGGRQRVRVSGGIGWRMLEPPLAALAPENAGPIRTWAAGTLPARSLPPGFHVCDAESERDLAEIARCASADGATLFVGTAGLAAALAGAPPPTLAAPEGLTLFLFGTAHPVTRDQMGRLAAGELAAAVAAGEPASMAGAVQAALKAGRSALIDLSRLAPEGSEAGPAAAHIAAALRALAHALPRPDHLLAGGGATLAALLEALGARALDALGRVEAGVPRSRIVGGAWDGVAVTSKSGGFGDPDLLVRLAADGG